MLGPCPRAMLAATCMSAASSSHTFAPLESEVVNATVLPSGLSTALPGPVPAGPDGPGTSTRLIAGGADPDRAREPRRAGAPAPTGDEPRAGRRVLWLARK